MGKTGFKTFVCSFSFSLLAFVGAGKEFLSADKIQDENLIIPTKNISLFFQDIPSHTATAKILPIKKIALRAPELVPLNIETQNIPQGTSSTLSVKEENTLHKSLANQDLIPLTFAQNNSPISENAQDFLKEKEASAQISSKTENIKQLAQLDTSPVPPSSLALDDNSSLDLDNEPSTNTVSTTDETFATELEPFANKTLHANVQIIRPNEKNIQKLRPQSIQTEDTNSPSDATNETDEQLPTETLDNSLPFEQEVQTPAQASEPHVIAMVPDTEDADEIKNNQVFENKASTQNQIEIPAFKVAVAKQKDDNFYSHPSVSTPQKEAAKKLLIPIEKDEPNTIVQAKVLETPEENRLAMLHNKTPINSMEQKNVKADTKDSEDNNNSSWQTMAEKNAEASSWIAAKGSGYVPNRKIEEENYYKSADKELIQKVLKEDTTVKNNGVKLASETVDNILIPIPKEILNDPNLTPKLVSSEQGRELEEKITEKENSEYKTNKEQATSKKENKTENNSGLLKSLTSIFSKSSKTSESTDNEEGDFFSRFKTKSPKLSEESKILPTEIRLAFQPNRAEISGVTLKWLQAFANKIIEDKNAGLEIRINGTSSYELQQKRLNLLNNILASNGVDFHKVKTIFTTREPNSFVIRTVRLNNENGGIREDNDWQDYYKVW